MTDALLSMAPVYHSTPINDVGITTPTRTVVSQVSGTETSSSDEFSSFDDDNPDEEIGPSPEDNGDISGSESSNSSTANHKNPLKSQFNIGGPAPVVASYNMGWPKRPCGMKRPGDVGAMIGQQTGGVMA